MKKMLGLVVCGMLVCGMVGCASTEDTTTEEDSTTVDRWEEANEKAIEEAKEAETKEKEVKANKEALAENIKDTIANSMGSNYEVAVVIADDGNCNIAIADTTTVYSGYDKDTLKAMSKQYGLESAVINIETSA